MPLGLGRTSNEQGVVVDKVEKKKHSIGRLSHKFPKLRRYAALNMPYHTSRGPRPLLTAPDNLLQSSPATALEFAWMGNDPS